MLPQNLAKIAFVLHFQLIRLWQLYDKAKLEKKSASSEAVKKRPFSSSIFGICQSDPAKYMAVDPGQKASSSKTDTNLDVDFEESKEETKQHARQNSRERRKKQGFFSIIGLGQNCYGMRKVVDYLLSFSNYVGGPMRGNQSVRRSENQLNVQQELTQIVRAGKRFCSILPKMFIAIT